jgi:microcystin-dependent protein
MGQPYVGEIRLFGGNFAPAGWAFCDGALISISQNSVLFQLIGTTYGGDGQQTFALPNLQSRLPVHQGTAPGGTYTIGQTAGVETVTLSTQQMPSHNHLVNAATSQQVLSPSGSFPANATSPTQAGVLVYDVATPPPAVKLNPATIQLSGGSQPHSNIQPYLALNFIISLYGIFPSRT